MGKYNHVMLYIQEDDLSGLRKYLLENTDYDINSSNKLTGITALHEAVNSGASKEIIEYLLGIKNIQASIQDREGRSPLELAVIRKKSNIALLFLYHLRETNQLPNLDVDLLAAMKNDDVDTAHYLIMFGAVIKSKEVALCGNQRMLMMLGRFGHVIGTFLKPEVTPDFLTLDEQKYFIGTDIKGEPLVNLETTLTLIRVSDNEVTHFVENQDRSEIALSAFRSRIEMQFTYWLTRGKNPEQLLNDLLGEESETKVATWLQELNTEELYYLTHLQVMLTEKEKIMGNAWLTNIVKSLPAEENQSLETLSLSTSFVRASNVNLKHLDKQLAVWEQVLELNYSCIVYDRNKSGARNSVYLVCGLIGFVYGVLSALIILLSVSVTKAGNNFLEGCEVLDDNPSLCIGNERTRCKVPVDDKHPDGYQCKDTGLRTSLVFIGLMVSIVVSIIGLSILITRLCLIERRIFPSRLPIKDLPSNQQSALEVFKKLLNALIIFYSDKAPDALKTQIDVFKKVYQYLETEVLTVDKLLLQISLVRLAFHEIMNHADAPNLIAQFEDVNFFPKIENAGRLNAFNLHSLSAVSLFAVKPSNDNDAGVVLEMTNLNKV